MRYSLATIVWGEEYTDLFANIVLPNLLTPGNLDAVCKTQSPVFRIFTTSKDAMKIKDSSAFKKVSACIAIEINEISDTDLAAKYTLSAKYHQKSIDAAVDDNAALLIVSPDILRAEGYMTNMLRIAENGKRALLISEIRVAKDTFLPEFIKRFSVNGAFRGIAPRQLAKLALEHLHPVSKSFLWNSKKFHNAPSYIYFEVPQEGLVARCFHLSPMMINPVCKDARFSTTLDGDYILNACPNIDDIYIASDSDEFMSVEMSSLSYPGNAGRRPPSPLNIAAFAKYSADRHSRIFVRHKMRFHFDDISPRWEKIEQFSDKAIDRIFYWLKFEPLLFWPYGIVMQAKLFVRNIIKSFLGESLTRKLAGRIRSMRTKTSRTMPALSQLTFDKNVCGLLFCYNEEQIIGETLKHYLSQGIDIVVFDNYSTDSSVDIVRSFQDKNNQYPGRILDVAHIKTQGYEWMKILRSACEYMHRNLKHYKWIMLIDADAFYYSPVRGLSLLEFINMVEKSGYNIINAKVFEFYPTERNDPRISSTIERLRYYRIVDKVAQHKIFLYHPKIDFYTKFAHICLRENPRIWTAIELIYKHYPWVSYEHGLKKIFKERKRRYAEQKDYPTAHAHYLSVLPLKRDLIRDAGKLCYFKEERILFSRSKFLLIMKLSFLRHLLNTMSSLREKSIVLSYLWNAFLYDKRSTTRKLLYLVYLEIRKLAILIKLNKFSRTLTLRDFVASIKSILISLKTVIQQESATFIFPHTYHFLMTNYCNAQCIFCNQKFENLVKSEITLEKFKIMISNIPKNTAKIFYFGGGGEPLLCRDLIPIIKYVNDTLPWIKVRVRTNGLLIGKYAKELAQLNISDLQISIHGLAEMNDIILQRKKSQDIFDGILQLNDYLKHFKKRMGKEFFVAVSRINIEQLPVIIKKAAALKVNRVTATFCRYFPYERHKISAVLKDEDSLFFHKQKYNTIIQKSKMNAALSGVTFNHEPLFFKEFKEKPCFQPWELVVVDWDGNIYPCTGGEVWFDKKVQSGEYYFGNLLKEHLHQCWNNDTFMKIRRTCNCKCRESFIPECKNCHNTICFKGADVKNGHILQLV